jgi:hypothetical protein
MDNLRKAGMLDKGGRSTKNRVAGRPGFPTLTKQGVDKNLADRARKAFAMTEKQFKAAVGRAIKLAVASIVNANEVIKPRARKQSGASCRTVPSATAVDGIIGAVGARRDPSHATRLGGFSAKTVRLTQLVPSPD